MFYLKVKLKFHYLQNMNDNSSLGHFFRCELLNNILYLIFWKNASKMKEN